MEFPIAFLHIPSQRHKGNGAPQNKKLTVYIMQSQNGTITSKDLKLMYLMTTYHWQDLSIEGMPITKSTDED